MSMNCSKFRKGSPYYLCFSQYFVPNFFVFPVAGFLKSRVVFGWASLVVQTVKNSPALQESWVQSLNREDPLEEGMAVHSSVLAWRIPWTEEPGGLQSMGSQRVDTTR